MRKTLRILLTAAAITAASAALALDVQEAKSAGWVGEQRDGYLGLVTSSAPPEARQLVTEINQARRASYQEIAGKNGIELRAVELLAAEKALQKTPSGQFIQAEDGSWSRK
ncbi:MAG: YdbL family protein [Gammaproteobacteria bacterium]|nr:YdbL family protein [Gammaproteobacteria bacterium]